MNKFIKVGAVPIFLLYTVFYLYGATKVDVDALNTNDGYGGGTLYTKDVRLVRLSNGTLVAFYGYDVHVSLCLAFKKSTDGGVTWTDHAGNPSSRTGINVGNSYDMRTCWSVCTDETNTNIYLVYKSGNTSNVAFRKITPSSWPGSDGVSTATTIATDLNNDYSYSHPTIAVQSTGRIWVAYNQYVSPNYGIKVWYSDDYGSTWTSTGVIANLSDSRNVPAITIWNDKPVVVYVRAAWNLDWSYYDSGTWTAPTKILDANGNNNFSMVVTGTSPNQKLHVVNNAMVHRIYDGSTWTTPVTIQTGSSDATPSLVSDGTHVWCFFSRWIGTNNYNISYKVWDGSSWSNYIDVFSDNFKYLYPAPCRYSSPGSIPFIWSSYTSTPMKAISSYLYNIPQITSISSNTGINTSTQTLSISGSNFYKETWKDVTSIKLVNGPTPTEYNFSSYSVIDNATILDAVIPSGCIAGTYDVRVTTSVGNSTNAIKFIVTGNPPTVSSITPDTSPNTSSKTVTITGTNFFGGTNTSDIISVKLNDPANTSLNISSATIADTLITGAIVPDKIAGGTYDVIVNTHAGSNSVSSGKFIVTAESPTVTNVSPNWGSDSGITTVTITGTNFFGGTLSSDVRGIKLSDGTILTYTGAIISDTLIQSAVVPIGASVGTWDVQVTTGGGTNSTSTIKFVVKPGPKVFTVEPVSGSNLAVTTVTITGEGFFGSGGTSPSVTSIRLTDPSSTSLSFNASNVLNDTTISGAQVPTGIIPGTYDIRVTTDMGSNATSAQKFVVTTDKPIVTSVNPAEGFNNQLTTISIVGDKFFGGTTSSNVYSVKLSNGADIIFTGASISNTSIGPCVIPSGIASGTYDVRVTTGGGESTNSVKFWVKSAVPVVSTITPNQASNSSVTTVSITGLNFYGGYSSSTVTNIKLNDPHAVTLSTFSVISDSVIVNILIPPGLHAGTWDVQIQSSQGTNDTSIQKFIVTCPSPTITSVSPSSIVNLTGGTLNISGTKFYGGTEVWIYEESDVRKVSIYGPLFNSPSETILSSYSCLSDSNILAVVPGGKLPGYYEVRVETGGGTAAGQTPIRILAPIPEVTSITPNKGVNTTSLTVTITGRYFYGGVGSDNVGGILLNIPENEVLISKVTVISDTELVGIVPAGVITGEYDIKIMTLSNQMNETSVSKFYSMIDKTINNLITHYTGVNINIPANTLSDNCAVLVKDASNNQLVLNANKIKYKNIKCPSNLDNTTKEITLTDGASIVSGKSISISLDYNVDDPVLEKDFRILTLYNNKWLIVPNQSVNIDSNKVSSDVTHLSIFRIGQYITQADNLNNVVVYPNPIDFGNAVNNTLKFVNLTYNPTLRVYTVSGELVKEIPPDSIGNIGNDGRIEWDGRNEEGSLVTRGLYIYLITDEAGNRKIGKFVVK